MASSIGEVLDIESSDSYIKRPTGPMVTVEVKDISKLAGIIRIPSMAEGAGPGDTTTQRILYSRLPNQCRKCRKFGHLARICPLNRSPMQSGNVPAKLHPEWREKKEQKENSDTQRWNTDKARRTESQQGKEGTRPTKAIPNKTRGSEKNPNYPKNPQHTVSKNLTTRGKVEKMRKEPIPLPPIHTPRPNQDMFERVTPLPHRQEVEQQELATMPYPVFSPRTRLLFVTTDLANSQVNGNMARTNPFAGSPGEWIEQIPNRNGLKIQRKGGPFRGK
jgi:hypothetical protein